MIVTAIASRICVLFALGATGCLSHLEYTPRQWDSMVRESKVTGTKVLPANKPRSASTQRNLTWKGGGNVRFADLSNWNQAEVTEKFGKPTEVFPIKKVGEPKIPHWAMPIPDGADIGWRYRPKDKNEPLVERIIFLRKGSPLLVVQTESDW
jgi:hypothetical protein